MLPGPPVQRGKANINHKLGKLGSRTANIRTRDATRNMGVLFNYIDEDINVMNVQ